MLCCYQDLVQGSPALVDHFGPPGLVTHAADTHHPGDLHLFSASWHGFVGGEHLPDPSQ
jgi:hypothetical protein